MLGLHDVGENPDLVFIVLITGPILGASLGFIVGKYELRRFIPFHDNEKEKKVQRYFREFGGLLLLISPWIPVVGDLAQLLRG